ncbi:MAG: ribosome biogenesis GTPase Der [Elusimicrobiota bacterium]
MLHKQEYDFCLQGVYSGMTKTIAIVGRPNVGKSTLFNTLINRKEALTSPNPGLTRDRTYSFFSPEGKNRYLLIDTGGLILGAERPIDEKVNMQVDIAIEESDLLLFVVDTKDGPVPLDEKIADKLRKISKPVLLVANKSDSPKYDMHSSEFFGLSLGEPLAVSAKEKRNITGIIERILTMLPDSEEDTDDEDRLRLCITGRPNVGKSTLMNSLAGENRVIVDDEPGTTRNPAKCYINIDGCDWEVIDLAGIWRKKRGKEIEEVLGMIAALKEIERANACIFMLDLSKPLSTGDSRIAGWIVEKATPVVIAGNKMDLIDISREKTEAYYDALIEKMPFMGFAPFVMISASDGTGIKKLKNELGRIKNNTFKQIDQEELDICLEKIIAHRPPPKAANIRPIVLKLYQKGVNPPVFRLVINHYRLDKIPQHWKNYVRNTIAKEFNYYGVPVTVQLKKHISSRNRRRKVR